MYKYRIPTPPSKSPSRSFTLVELIIVIIIVGVLAAVGISQYSKTVEKGRGAEARMILGQMRKLAYEYYLENGTAIGLTDSYLGVGTSADQIPSTCRSSHYFYYGLAGCSPGTTCGFSAFRCTSGGKTPQGSGDSLCLQASFDGVGSDWWGIWAGCCGCTAGKSPY